MQIGRREGAVSRWINRGPASRGRGWRNRTLRRHLPYRPGTSAMRNAEISTSAVELCARRNQARAFLWADMMSALTARLAASARAAASAAALPSHSSRASPAPKVVVRSPQAWATATSRRPTSMARRKTCLLQLASSRYSMLSRRQPIRERAAARSCRVLCARRALRQATWWVQKRASRAKTELGPCDEFRA